MMQMDCLPLPVSSPAPIDVLAGKLGLTAPVVVRVKMYREEVTSTLFWIKDITMISH
ncbi:MAG: hypothetical protein IPN36_12575 [Bacteroidetes bacterium]|nr:hypothetical protein [Bacteroidota bacterium]